jgi:hypothetical protein
MKLICVNLYNLCSVMFISNLRTPEIFGGAETDTESEVFCVTYLFSYRTIFNDAVSS